MTAWHDRTIDLGGPLRVVDFGGDGPCTFVCVHGLGGWSLDWQLLAPELTRHGRVLAFDLPGFGDSPLAGRPAGIADHQRLLQRFLARMVSGRVVLMGNSMGGAVSLLHAVRHPGTVERLVLVSPVLPASGRRLAHPLVAAQFVVYTTPLLGEWYMQARRVGADPRALVDRSTAFILASTDGIAPEVFEQRYALAERRAARPDSDLAFLASARSTVRLLVGRAGYRRLIRRVAVPTMVVHGAADRLVPASSARALTRLRPDWAVTVLPDVGHVAQLEAPHAIAELVLSWMSRTSARPRRWPRGGRSRLPSACR